MSESQAHGFKIEAAILRSSLLRATPVHLAYNAAVDAPAGHSLWSANPEFPVQIKSAKAGSKTFCIDAAPHVDADVGLADAERSFSTGGLEVIVCAHRQDADDAKTALAYHRMLFRPGSWAKLFGTLSSAELAELCQAVKAKPAAGISRAGFDAITASLHAKARALEATHAMMAKLRIKIDSKGQRRVQFGCALSALHGAADEREVITLAGFGAAGLPSHYPSKARERVQKEKPAKAGKIDRASLKAARCARLRLALADQLGSDPASASKSEWSRAAKSVGLAACLVRKMLNDSFGPKRARAAEAALGLDPLWLDQALP